ncbi:MAG: 50S ribosomal protein L10 [Pseudomonadota bacterium]
MKRNEKAEVIKNLHGKLDRAKAAVVTDFRGLNVETVNALRGQLRNSHGEFKVVKNTLMNLAAKGTEVEVLGDQLAGPCGLAISYEDPVAIARLLVEFAKTNPKLEIKGGVLQGKLMTDEAVRTLARLPSREVLLGKLLSVLVGPPTGMVRVMNGMICKFLYTLKAIEEQKAAS